MRAYLIDPETKTIEQVDYDGQLGSLYDLLRCRTAEAHQISGNDFVYVDEEARLTAKTDAARFLVLSRPFWLIGRGLVVGADRHKDDCNAHMSIESLRLLVQFRP